MRLLFIGKRKEENGGGENITQRFILMMSNYRNRIQMIFPCEKDRFEGTNTSIVET